MMTIHRVMVTAEDKPPIKTSRLVGFLFTGSYYTRKLYEENQHLRFYLSSFHGNKAQVALLQTNSYGVSFLKLALQYLG